MQTNRGGSGAVLPDQGKQKAQENKAKNEEIGIRCQMNDSAERMDAVDRDGLLAPRDSQSPQPAPQVNAGVRRREEKGFAWNRYLESAAYSSKHAIPRRSPPGIANTSAGPSNPSRPTGPSPLPRPDSLRVCPRS